MRPLVLLLTLASSGICAETWKQYSAGPVSVISPNLDKESAITLNALDQYRHTLGQMLGLDLEPVWPIRLVLLKQSSVYSNATSFAFKRATYTAVIQSGRPVTPALYNSLGRVLFNDCISGMPPEYEEALLSLFSTLQVDGVRVTLGALPEPGARTRLWALMHMLAVDPRFSGRLRVMLSNMRKGIEPEVALRTAFEQPADAIYKEVSAYMAAPITGSAKLSGHAVEVLRNNLGREKDPPFGDLMLADLKWPNPEPYRAILEKFPSSSEANEGLGLITKDKAVLAKSLEARAQAELYTFETLRAAAGKNPKWGEPARRLAELEKDTGRKLALMKKYAELTPRDWEYMGLYAKALEADEKFSEAARIWLLAERAAPTQAAKQQLRESRLSSMDKRADAEAEARRKDQEEKRLDLERVKNEAMSRIREAEARANGGNSPLAPNVKVEKWWDGPQADAQTKGVLERVDCLKGFTKITVRTPDKKAVSLGITDPSKIPILGTASLACGVQRPLRNVQVDYNNKPDKVRQVSGEVVRLELQ